MGLHIEADDKVIIEDGDIIAVQKQDRVEVWDGEGDGMLFTLWPNASPEQVNIVKAVHDRAFNAGVNHGKWQKLREIRSLVQAIFGPDKD